MNAGRTDERLPSGDNWRIYMKSSTIVWMIFSIILVSCGNGARGKSNECIDESPLLTYTKYPTYTRYPTYTKITSDSEEPIIWVKSALFVKEEKMLFEIPSTWFQGNQMFFDNLTYNTAPKAKVGYKMEVYSMHMGGSEEETRREYIRTGQIEKMISDEVEIIKIEESIINGINAINVQTKKGPTEFQITYYWKNDTFWLLWSNIGESSGEWYMGIYEHTKNSFRTA
jgi:hypothetical protein